MGFWLKLWSLRTQKSDRSSMQWLLDWFGFEFDWWPFDLVGESTMNGGDEVVTAPVEPPQPLEWKFSQVFGERTAGEEVQEGIYKYIYYIMFSIFFW